MRPLGRHSRTGLSPRDLRLMLDKPGSSPPGGCREDARAGDRPPEIPA